MVEHNIGHREGYRQQTDKYVPETRSLFEGIQALHGALNLRIHVCMILYIHDSFTALFNFEQKEDKKPQTICPWFLARN